MAADLPRICALHARTEPAPYSRVVRRRLCRLFRQREVRCGQVLAGAGPGRISRDTRKIADDEPAAGVGGHGVLAGVQEPCAWSGRVLRALVAAGALPAHEQEAVAGDAVLRPDVE